MIWARMGTNNAPLWFILWTEQDLEETIQGVDLFVCVRSEGYNPIPAFLKSEGYICPKDSLEDL